MATVGFGSKSSSKEDEAGLIGPITNRENGGEEGARTPDLSDANAALSQLSYFPEDATYNPRFGRTSTNRSAPNRGHRHRALRRAQLLETT